MSKSQANQEITEILERAIKINKSNKSKPELAKKLIKKAKRIAMHYHIKIPEEYKSKFCKKCFTIFNTSNSKIRIKKGFQVIKCLNCDYTRKKKLI